MGILNAKCSSTARLDDKTIVITGCNTGIGKECCKDFYIRGGNIIMACRSIDKTKAAIESIKEECKALNNLGSLRPVKLDLTSFMSIRSCVQKIKENEQKIDILLNNAGIMATPKARTEEGFELQFGTNHIGHFYFTLLLLPLIIASDSRPARIVNVSSVAHFMGKMDFKDLNWIKRKYSSTDAYSQSKLANVLFSKELDRRLKGAGINHIHTYALHPGVIKTELARHLDYSLCSGFTWLFNTVAMKNVVEGAQTSIHCCVCEDCADDSGLYYRECETAYCSPTANNEEVAKRLWKESLMLTSLDDPLVEKH